MSESIKPPAFEAPRVAEQKLSPEKRLEMIGEYVAFAQELAARPEAFPAVSMSQAIIDTWLADEQDEQMGPFTPPLAEVQADFKAHGMRVRMGENPSNGNVKVTPANTEDRDRGVFPRDLVISEGMDTQLKELIERDRALYNALKAK